MNNQPSYKEQFDKITRAYLANELNPWDSCACFIGNMLNKDFEWATARCFNYDVLFTFDILSGYSKERSEKCLNKQAGGFYTLNEVYNLEANFLKLVRVNSPGILRYTEDALFHAMESTLEMLKQIHISKGEQVDNIPFAKRELQTA